MEIDIVKTTDDDETSSVTQRNLQSPSSSNSPAGYVSTRFETSLKLEIATSPIQLQIEPHPHETIEESLPTLRFLDPSKLQRISLEIPFPVTKLSPINMPPATKESQLVPLEKSRSRSLVHVPVCCGQLKAARRQSLDKVGIPSLSNEKKLLMAVRNNDVSTVIRLLEDGINPNVSDSKRRTALHIAASQGLDHIVSSLTAKGADPNRVDILGNSPLHLAACCGDTRIVRILIGSGANIHKKDNTGRTPFDIVKSRLNTLRRDKSVSTDKLIGECQMICDILKIHAQRLPYRESAQVDALCTMMRNVSTREQADEYADAVLNRMSDLSLEHK
ncbi:ankyrin repeat domain-containing protein 54-like protein [Plakobranchus ocellatus]|uniref:Ankyrin repeat domain-containing protein 54-like protein n=1 Tax=Plakobranchus ocellatus TaxID=259542 RepID=A0AAV4D352_9GAST|nr:ankyrin repeat domain-containing protein 54-like protein [Plakobranchus ocellatus]